MQFKTDRLREEMNQLLVKNTELWKLMDVLDVYAKLEFSKDIVITSIFRTEEENAALYAATPIDKRPARSPHMDWKAVDIRSSNFTDAEITKMLAFLNCFTNKNGKRIALYHEIPGNVKHFHIQYKL